MTPLLVAFSVEEPTVRSEDGTVIVCIDGDEHRLSRATARTLADDLGDAVTERREFFRTAGEHRQDGSYVVSRRGADSSGNEKVFDSFARVERIFERLSESFTADDVSRTGITGSRRHMLVRHFAEHPAFDCEIARRSPLTVEKREPETSIEEVVAGD